MNFSSRKLVLAALALFAAGTLAWAGWMLWRPAFPLPERQSPPAMDQMVPAAEWAAPPREPALRPRTDRWPAPGEALHVPCGGAIKLSGVVRHNNSSMAGVRVRANEWPERSLITNAAGQFQLEGLYPRTYFLLAEHGALRSGLVRLSLHSAQLEEIPLQLAAAEDPDAPTPLPENQPQETGGASLTIHLKLPDNAAASSAVVELIGADPQGWRMFAAVCGTTLKLDQLPARVVLVQAYTETLRAAPVRVNLRTQEGKPLELLLQHGAPLRGQLRVPPLGRLTQVHAQPLRSQDGDLRFSLPIESTVADREGHFAFHNLPPGKVRVWASEGPALERRTLGYVEAEIVEAPLENLALDMQGRGSVRGKIRFSDGSPPRRVRLTVDDLPPPVELDIQSGAFSVEDIGAGEHRLEFSGPDFVARRLEKITIAANQTFDLGEIVISPAAALRGTIQNTDGQPVSGAVVYASPVLTGGQLAPVPQGVTGLTASGVHFGATDSEGRYELGPLPHGSWVLLARDGRGVLWTEPITAASEMHIPRTGSPPAAPAGMKTPVLNLHPTGGVELSRHVSALSEAAGPALGLLAPINAPLYWRLGETARLSVRFEAVARAEYAGAMITPLRNGWRLMTWRRFWSAPGADRRMDFPPFSGGGSARVEISGAPRGKMIFTVILRGKTSAADTRALLDQLAGNGGDGVLQLAEQPVFSAGNLPPDTYTALAGALPNPLGEGMSPVHVLRANPPLELRACQLTTGINQPGTCEISLSSSPGR
ncbi:MAG: hypothetical protein GMKNLPBB_01852 [Myxococcota bacterium]|nr:hypothetical protein [Myxococcota bacterium]